jgi:hypothetical protein
MAMLLNIFDSPVHRLPDFVRIKCHLGSRGAYNILVERPEGRRLLGRPRRR